MGFVVSGEYVGWDCPLLSTSPYPHLPPYPTPYFPLIP